ncbi:MAG: type 1 pili tip component [Woeseiaceae bacterium]|nr:type 1 pili tip component [Woeseiaceae bacterium]
MTYKELLDAWATNKSPSKTRERYAVQLTVDDAARVHALAELFDGVDEERVITDLLTTALDELQAAIPYEPGDKVIREDEFGDPVYEDRGLTPRFLELVRKYQDDLDQA